MTLSLNFRVSRALPTNSLILFLLDNLINKTCFVHLFVRFFSLPTNQLLGSNLIDWIGLAYLSDFFAVRARDQKLKPKFLNVPAPCGRKDRLFFLFCFCEIGVPKRASSFCVQYLALLAGRLTLKKNKSVRNLHFLLKEYEKVGCRFPIFRFSLSEMQTVLIWRS